MSDLSNFEKWRSYTSGLPSPDNFINWSFYYMIGAALQRRVWMPPNHDRVYGNQYVTLTGKSSTGKGGPIRAVSKIIDFHKLEDANKDINESWTSQEKELAAYTLSADIKMAQDLDTKGASSELTSAVKPALIPRASDATSYEALVEYMAKNIRRINYTKPDGTMGLYSHCSTCFVLEEIASLFRKKSEDVINFLIQAYDCGDDYSKRTKTQGNDRILRMCLNFLGGTTPDFMQQTFDDALINQGYASRTFFVYGFKPRSVVSFRPELSDEQIQYYKDLLVHVKSLTKLYGQCIVEDDTRKFFHDWLESFHKDPAKYGFASEKLEPFRGRMNIHVMKMAMAHHFADKTDMTIGIKSFQSAIDFICAEGKNMHMALTMGADNPLAKSSQKIQDYLEMAGPRTFKQLLAQFWEKVNRKELEEVLEYLQMVDSVVAVEEKQPDETTVMKYKVRGSII